MVEEAKRKNRRIFNAAATVAIAVAIARITYNFLCPLTPSVFHWMAASPAGIRRS
jgi:hypothetical protein